MVAKTALFAGLSALSAVSQLSAGRDQAEAIARQAEVEAAEQAKQTRLRLARERSSFLSSGFTMSGTPSMSLAGIADVGLQDIDQIRSNAVARSKSVLSEARAGAMSNLAMAGASFGFPSSGAAAARSGINPHTGSLIKSRNGMLGGGV